MLTRGLRKRPAHVKQYHCSSLKEYIARYLISDICQFSDVFEAFRNQLLDEYKLEPAYFESAQQFAWNALFKLIDGPIPLITDPEMYRII